MHQVIVIAGITGVLLAASAALAENDPSQPTPNDQSFSSHMRYTGERMGDNVVVVGEHAGNAVGRVATNFRDAFHNTGDRLQKWWFTRETKAYPSAIPSSYCYRVLQDIVCYRQPMPGWEHRLAGYQGTFAEAPPPAMMRPLPTRAIIAESTLPSSSAKLPVGPAIPAHVEAAKPVFGEIPPEPEEAKTAEEALPELDAAHETLPDPALAPQL